MPLALKITGELDPGDLVAASALLLSLLALAVPWWRQRAARISVRIDHYWTPETEAVRQHWRLVVVNLGPADAKHVFIEMCHKDQPINPGTYLRVPPKSLVLHSGEQFHISFGGQAFGDQLPDRVTVSWVDHRPGRRTQTFWPVPQDVV